MADNNEGFSALPESLIRGMDFLNEVPKNAIDSVDDYKLMYSLSSEVINELEIDYPGRFGEELNKYKGIQKFMGLKLKENGIMDYKPDPEITMVPEYIDKSIEQKLRLFNSIVKNDPFAYNGRELPPGVDSPNGTALLTISLMEDLEKELKQRMLEQNFVEGDEFYKQSYKHVVEQAIEFADSGKSRPLQTFLGERERIEMIDVVFEENTAPIKDIITMNMDPEVDSFGRRKINPETLIYNMQRNFIDNSSGEIQGVFDGENNYSARVIELKILKERLQENPELLDYEHIASLQKIVGSIENFEENLTDEQREQYENWEMQMREQNIIFDNVGDNRFALKKEIFNNGYSPDPDSPGQWMKNSEMRENSIKMIAEWEKKFEEKLLEHDAANYNTFDKIKRKKFGLFGDIDYSNSSYFTMSVVEKDEYGNPKSTLYNVSRLTKSMEFTGAGLRSEKSYELAAINARKNGWKTVTLRFNGEPEEGIQFMKKSIEALRETGNYTFDDIIVPKKYANVLEKMREQELTMSEKPLEGTEEEYTSLGETNKNKNQEKRAADDMNGVGAEKEPSQNSQEPFNDERNGSQDETSDIITSEDEDEPEYNDALDATYQQEPDVMEEGMSSNDDWEVGYDMDEIDNMADRMAEADEVDFSHGEQVISENRGDSPNPDIDVDQDFKPDNRRRNNSLSKK